jgi:hypothetical protein
VQAPGPPPPSHTHTETDTYLPEECIECQAKPNEGQPKERQEPLHTSTTRAADEDQHSQHIHSLLTRTSACVRKH